MRNKKVVVVQSYVPEYRKRFFELLEKELKSEGFELLLDIDRKETFNSQSGDSALPEVNLSFHNSRHVYTPWGPISFRPIKSTNLRADVLVIEQALKNVTNLLLLLIRRILRKRTVVWGHGIDFVNPKSFPKRTLRSALLRGADMAFVYTDSARMALLEKGTPERKLVTLQNSTDTRDIVNRLSKITTREKSTFKAKHNITENNVLYMGSFTLSKNLDLLFDSLTYTRELIPDLTLTILGSGPLEFKVTSFVEAHPWVCFLGRDEGQKVLALSTAKLIVIAGRVGLVATDSFASGVPIVTVENSFHAPEFDYLDPPTDSRVFASDPVSLGQGIAESLATGVNERLREAVLAKQNTFSIELMASNFCLGIKRVEEN